VNRLKRVPRKDRAVNGIHFEPEAHYKNIILFGRRSVLPEVLFMIFNTR